MSRRSPAEHPGQVNEWTRVFEFPLRRPRAAIAVTLGLCVLAALGLPMLRVDSSYVALFASDAPMLRELERVRRRTGGHEPLVIALSGLPAEELDRVAHALARRAAARPDVAHAYASFDTTFFERRALWAMDDAAVDELLIEARALLASVHRSVAGAPGGEERATRRRAFERIRAVRERARSARPDLELATDDGQYRLVFLVPRAPVMDVARTAPLIAGLERLIADEATRHLALRARFTGKFALVLEHQAMLQRDLFVTSIVGIVLCLALVALFFRSLRAAPVLGTPVAVAALWTLGIAGAAVGRLNIVSTLLLPVIAGLGIDFAIHLAMRYEQLRASEPDARSAMASAIAETWMPALTSALTTAGAFLAVALSELQGLVELGVLTAVGVSCSLIATYLVLPPLLVARDRGRPRPVSSDAALSPRHSTRRVSIVVAVAGAVLALIAGYAGRTLRFENDYRLLRSDSDSDTFFASVHESLGIRFDPTVLLLADARDLERTRAVLERRRANGRVEQVIGLDDFLPRDTARRRRAIAELRALLADPWLDLADDPRIAEARAIAAEQPWTAAELPAWVRELFVPTDGRGAIVLVYGDESIQSDAQALRWNTELAEVRRALDHADVRYDMATEALLPAWVYLALRHDAPRLIGFAALVVALLVLVHFVRARGALGIVHAALVLGPLAVGVIWAVGIMGAGGLRVTMFNLVVFPCVIGVGVDDFIHLVHRHGTTATPRAIVRESGPAILLTSLTTGAGFGATAMARHPGVANVAPAALIAIACTTLAALVFLPAVLRAFAPKEGR